MKLPNDLKGPKLLQDYETLLGFSFNSQTLYVSLIARQSPRCVEEKEKEQNPLKQP